MALGYQKGAEIKCINAYIARDEILCKTYVHG